MRLSEAIMLGRHLVKPGPYDIKCCALGMALHACDTPLYQISVLGYVVVCQLWPWLDFCPEEGLPCNCHDIKEIDRNTYTKALTHLFDSHVAPVDEKYRDWTLEQLVDWVRSVEPEQDSAFHSETPEEQIAPALANGMGDCDFTLSSQRE